MTNPFIHTKKILYFDLDDTLVSFETGIMALSETDRLAFTGRYDEHPEIFSLMTPLEGAIEAFHTLSKVYDVFILSTAPWDNPYAWMHKIEWVQKYFGNVNGTPAYKRLILSHHKELNRGDYLVDDRPNNGAEQFEGEWIRIGSQEFPDWATITEYLLTKVNK